VLTTYIAGIPELVIHEENGWLFPAGDIERLTDAMQACLQATPEQLAAMGQAAQLRAVERHSVNVEAAKLARLFNAHLAPQPQALGLAAPAGGAR